LGKDFKRQNNGRQNDFKIILSSIPGLRQGRHFVFFGSGLAGLGPLVLQLVIRIKNKIKMLILNLR
jgi:hypothetical protein